MNGNLIYFLLSGKKCTSRRKIESLRYGIGELASNGIIDIVDADRDGGYILDLKNIDIPKNSKQQKEYYTIIESEEIYKIINSRHQSSFKILRYFVYLASTFHKNKKEATYLKPEVSFQSLKEMYEATKIDKNTISKYNDILQELELIYVYKASDVVIKDCGDISGITHTYGRFKNKDQVIKSGKEHEMTYGYEYKTKINKERGNLTRSASHKYNSFRDGKVYSEVELKEMYTVLKEFNERQTDSKSLKDLSIFSEFDFYDSA